MAEPDIEPVLECSASDASVFLANVHYFFGQTDGSYRWPEGLLGDLLRQAKREIEALRAVHPGSPS